jgi:murein DD-endopeptidase MepM/ murein hydrolase activator NlpD
VKQGRLVSALWTTIVVLCATAALIVIVRFMTSVHRGWPADGKDDGAAAAVVPRSAPAGPSSRPMPDAAVIGPADAHPVDARGTTRPVEPGGERPLGDVPTAVAAALKARRLTMPVVGVRSDALVPSFTQARGDRTHEALDIMAPAGTPVVAVEDGTVAKLFTSKAGGFTVYHFDPSRSVAYYYAHLQGYAPGLEDGDTLRRGQVIGYVGSTGNADPKAPHLHFAIFRLGPERRWWEGTAIDPYLVLR